MKTSGLIEQIKLLNQLVDSGPAGIANAANIEASIRKANPNAKFPSVACAVELRKFVTKDPELINLKEDIKIAAAEDDSVILYGDTGVGKDIIARALHAHRIGPFVPINCTALPDYLLESELFGHVRGSFTGAFMEKVGLLQYAWNGTIFLDEVGDMPQLLQSKLLHALQNKTIRRVGSNEPIPINCRIVSATNRDMKLMLSEGKFRKDLYFRLSTLEFHISPLHKRYPDVLEIARYYGADDKVLEHLQTLINKNYNFIGNVREIQRIIRRYIVLDKL